MMPRTLTRWAVGTAMTVLVFGAFGCMPSGGAGPGPSTDRLPPPGLGTLRQDDISVRFTAGELELRVTPLAEWVIRLTGPETHRRLAGLAAGVAPAPVEGALPVLVSIYTEAPGGAAFEARELELENRGRRFRPISVHGLTQAWGTGRLEQGETAQGLYLFPAGVDLEMELRMRFGSAVSSGWSTVLPRLEAERERVRRRTGGPLTPPDRTS